MKKLSVLVVAMLCSLAMFSQEQVKWSYVAKKVKDKTYEIRVIASIAPGWFIYAQQQPPQSISQPTQIAFVKNPLVNLSGKVTEEGTMVQKEYKVLGIKSNTYLDTVSFIQTVTLKADVRTNVEGTVRYQVCNANMCMPPEDAKFSVLLQ